MIIKKTHAPRPSRPAPPPHSFLDLSAEELKQMLCEEEKNVNATARSFSSDAERMTALQTGDAGLSGEVPNLQDGVISSPLGRTSHGDNVPKLGHVAALDDIAQGTSDGSSGQNIVESKRLRNTADGCSWESTRSKNDPSTTQWKNQKPAAVSQLGSRPNEDASARPEHSATLDDILQSSDAGSSGQNIVEQKRLRNTADGCSWESKRSKNSSSTSLGKSQKPAVTSPLGPSSDGDTSTKPKHPGDKRSPKNYFSGFSGKIRGGLVTCILVCIMLIITLRGYSNLPVNLSKAFASYSNIRIYENWFSEEPASLDIQGNRNPYDTAGSIDINSRPSSNQNEQVATPVDGNESSDKNDEPPNKLQDAEGVQPPTWLRLLLTVLVIAGPIIYSALNNYLISPSTPISVIDAFGMTFMMSMLIWVLYSRPQYMHGMIKHVFR